MKKIILLSFLVAASVYGCGQKDEPQQQFSPPVGQGQPQMGGPVQGFDKAKMLQEVVAKDPKNLNAWIELGNIMMDTQRFSEAIDAYKKALELDPRNVNVRVDMGTCYRSSGKPDIALQEYKKAVEINPNHVTVHKNMGVVYANDLKDYKLAVQEFEKALALAPNAPDAAGIRAEVDRLKAIAK